MSTNRKKVKNYSGIFGNEVFLKNRRGKSIMSMPHVKSKVPPTAKQITVRERVKLAVAYAKNAMNDPALLALYSAKAINGLSPYRQALYDYLRPPYIHKVDTSEYHGNTGEKITVVAGEDFQLASVSIRISGSDGTLIEAGTCVLNTPTRNYEYTATVQVPALTGVVILARAKDTPGNVTN